MTSNGKTPGEKKGETIGGEGNYTKEDTCGKILRHANIKKGWGKGITKVVTYFLEGGMYLRGKTSERKEGRRSKDLLTISATISRCLK